MGKFVVAPDHWDALVTVFPDGTYLKRLEDIASFNVDGLQDRVRDLGFAMDELQRMNQDDPVISRGLDLSRVSAMGWSWGAETAGEFCRVDSRCDVAVSLEWGSGVTQTAPELVRLGLQKPSLMLNAADNPSDFLFSKANQDAYWIQIGNTTHNSFHGYYWWYQPNSLPSAREAARTINSYALSFFNKYLKGQDDHLLDGRSPDYPRVIGFKKK